MYTSYYGNYRKLFGVTPVSISISKPKNIDCAVYKRLAPIYTMLSMSESKYIQVYHEILSRLNPFQVLSDLKEIAGSKPFVLLCYEKPNEFCHRHLVADWLNTNCKTRIIEYGSDELTLF